MDKSIGRNADCNDRILRRLHTGPIHTRTSNQKNQNAFIKPKHGSQAVLPTSTFTNSKEVDDAMMKDISVDIAGREYQLKTDEDPDYVRELANFVTVKILEIKRDSGASALDCATMAALDMADRYLKELQKKNKAAKKKSSQNEAEPTTLL